MVILALLALAPQAFAQTSPRGAEHDGFGRMVFDWDGAPQFSAEVAGTQLVVRFDKPMTGDPKQLLKPLGKYLKSATLSADRRTATFALAMPVQIKPFVTGNATVVDLTEIKGPAPAAKPAPTPPPAAKPAAATELMVRGGEHEGFNRLVFDWPQPVDYRVANEAGRLVITFDRLANVNVTSLEAALPTDVRFVESRPQGKGTVIVLSVPANMAVKHFTTGPKVAVDLVKGAAPKPAKPEPQIAKAEPPKPEPAKVEVPKVEPVKPEPTKVEPAKPGPTKIEPAKPVPAKPEPGLGLARPLAPLSPELLAPVKAVPILPPPPGAASAKPEPAPAKTEPVVAKPEPVPAKTEPVVAKPEPVPAKTEPVVAKPEPAPAKTEPAMLVPPAPPMALAPVLPPAPAAKADSGKALTPPIPVTAAAPSGPLPAVVPSLPPKPAQVVSLGVSFDQPSGAAAFRRAGWLWLVFDRKAEVDTKLLKRTGGDVVLHVEQVPTVKNGTALRLITKQGFNPSIRKEGQLWVFDLSEQPIAPKTSIPVNRQFDFEERGRLMLAAADASNEPVLIRDPEVGDTIQVMPLPTIGQGVRDETVVPGAQLLPTAQGVALVPLADGVRLESHRADIEVSMPGGLHLSREIGPSGDAGGAHVESDGAVAQPSGGNPLEVARWLRGGQDKFVTEHQKLMQRMSYVKPEDKNAQRLEIARHYFANGMPAEALGLLRVIAATDPAAVDTGNFRGLRGAANFLMLRDNEAVDDLSHASLAHDPQAQTWLAAAKARSSGEMAKNALQLRLAPDEIKGMSARLRMGLGKVAAQSVAAAGDYKGANRIIEAMNGPGLSRRDLGTISYLQGLSAEAGKLWDQAVAKYRDAEDSESRPDRAHAARNRIELQLRRNQITANEAIEQLEKMRFAWRADDYEYRLLKRLGELMLAAGRFGDGLRHLHSLVANYGDHPDIASVQRMMNEAFERLYLAGGADVLSPVTAIGLYDEFQELTPSGEKGDEMIRKLADRLAAVDLLDRSADLLRHQVQFRLSGTEKARVGARLAVLELADRKPAQALESLDNSEVPDQPPELYDQRRYLRVRALSEQGRAAEALALIINDQSEPAKQLRAQIYWTLKKWPEAAAALEASIERPEGASPLPPTAARRLIDLATAMTLARDERGLQRLRRTYGSRMATTEYKEAFDLLTSESERGIVDYRRVPEKIKQVENFQTFMHDWRKRFQTQGLSSIN